MCFAFGAFIGGRIIRRFGEHRARHLLISSIVQAAFILAALIGLYLLNHYSAEPALGMGSIQVSSQPSLNFPTARHIDVHHLMLIVLIAPAMGIQNSTARRSRARPADDRADDDRDRHRRRHIRPRP